MSVEAGGYVGSRNTDLAGRTVGFTCAIRRLGESLSVHIANAHVHESSLRFDNDIVSGRFRIRSRLSITCNAGVDQAWVNLLAVLPAETHRRQLARDVVLYKDVGLGDQFMQDSETLRLLKVDCDRTLVAIHR